VKQLTQAAYASWRLLGIAFGISPVRTLDLIYHLAPTLKLAVVRFFIRVLVDELILILVDELVAVLVDELILILVGDLILVLVDELVAVLVGELILILVDELILVLVDELIVVVILLGRTLVPGFRLTLGPVDNLAGIVVQGDADIQFLPAEQDVTGDVDLANR